MAPSESHIWEKGMGGIAVQRANQAQTQRRGKRENVSGGKASRRGELLT